MYKFLFDKIYILFYINDHKEEKQIYNKKKRTPLTIINRQQKEFAYDI